MVYYDRIRERLSFYKIYHFFCFFIFEKYRTPLGFYKSFLDVDFDFLWNNEKRGIILDVDGCIAFDRSYILQENIEKIRQLLSKGFKIVIFSNMRKTDRYEELEKIGIVVNRSIYGKPHPAGFREALYILGLKPEETVMIGDNFLTDGGSIRLGIEFVKVKHLLGVSHRSGIRKFLPDIFRKLADMCVGEP